jgi:hypothetical protein
MMEAARTSETLVNFYQTTWRYNPEDGHLHNENYLNDLAFRSTYFGFGLFEYEKLVNFL